MPASGNTNRTLFELDLLRAMVMVADCGSFTTAAARLHSTQSTISQKIRRLEAIAGRPLLVRGNRDVHPPMPDRPCLASRGRCCRSTTRCAKHWPAPPSR
jgi:hypothetical protein